MKLTVETANIIRSVYAEGQLSQAAISKQFGVCQMTISKVIRGVVYTEERPSERERFFSYVNTAPGQGPKGECHEWSGCCAGSGYGQFTRERSTTQINASRLAWEFRHGDIPPKMEICHHCDNRKCCRDEHLFIGTHQDNMQDAKKKGRLSNRKIA